MKVKFVFLAVVVLLIAGGVFLFLENQNTVKELNKNLPEGVKVVKSLFGNEYTVVNKADGYEFRIPTNWSKPTEIGYVPERTEQGYAVTSITVTGSSKFDQDVTVDRFTAPPPSPDLETWAKTSFETLGLVGTNFSKAKVGDFEIVKTQEEVHFLGDFIYWFQTDSVVYAITSGWEEDIKNVIANGSW